MTDRNDLIIQWANQALMYYTDERAKKLAESVLPLTAASMRAAIIPTDRHGYIFAGQMLDAGKWQPGTLMVLPDRVHLSWSTGLLRPKSHSRRIDFPRETKVLIDERPIRESRIALPMRKVRLDGTPSGHVFGISALDGWEPALWTAQGLTEGWVTLGEDESEGDS